LFVNKQKLCIYIINPRIYHILRRHVFLLIYFIKIYNLYFLFLYIITKVKIHYKRKQIHSEKIVKLKILLILILILTSGKIWPKIWLYFTSHPKFYKKTYVECKIIQTSLGNYIFQTITSIFCHNTLSCYLKVLPVYNVARFITSQFNLNT
jgi:hypothetical protein